MEKAIYINSIEQCENWSEGYGRIYFGSEFCERALPGWTQVEKVAQFAADHDLHLSFLTAYYGNAGLEKVKDILYRVNSLGRKTEVIVNDWGLMYFLTQENGLDMLEPVLGRLLNKLPRDPRISNIYTSINTYQKEAMGSTNIRHEWVRNFWKSRGVKRVELDNVCQDIFLPEDEDISYSLYYPYVFISTTRDCLTNSCDQELVLSREKRECGRECKRYTFTLDHAILPEKIFYKGNAYLFYNADIEAKLALKSINRLVYQPQL